MRCAISVFFVQFLIPIQLFGLSFELRDRTQFTPNEQQKVEEYFRQVQELLPDKLKTALNNRVIKVNFEPSRTSEERIPFPVCQPQNEPSSEKSNITLGHTVIPNRWVGKKFVAVPEETNKVALNILLLKEITIGAQDSPTFSCGLRSMYRLALGVLIHEVTHIYDYVTHASSSTRFRVASRWKKGWFGPYQANQIRYRSPNQYEFKNPKEMLSVNMEYFILDPEYRCRKPTLSKFFSEEFELREFPKCKINYNAPISSTFSGKSRSLDLNPKRLFAVHYLIASKGSGIISGFGHSMFRLIYCNPIRIEVDEECLKDLDQHIVVSYRANVNDLMIDSMKGLFGGYPSKIFLLTFTGVYSEYVQEELRDLVSVPLRVNPEDFLNSVLEDFWSYQGSYSFFTNNCATESNALIFRTVEKGPHRFSHAITPWGVYEDLEKSHLLDTNVLLDDGNAKKWGYIFNGDGERFLTDIKTIKKSLGRVHVTFNFSFNEYLLTTPEARDQWFQKLQLTSQGTELKSVAAAFSQLEKYILDLHSRNVRSQLLEFFYRNNAKQIVSEDLIKLWTLVQEVKKRTEIIADVPSTLKTGYGLPLEGESNKFLDQIELTDQRLTEISKEMTDTLKSHYGNKTLSIQANFRKFLKVLFD